MTNITDPDAEFMVEGVKSPVTNRKNLVEMTEYARMGFKRARQVAAGNEALLKVIDQLETEYEQIMAAALLLSTNYYSLCYRDEEGIRKILKDGSDKLARVEMGKLLRASYEGLA